jgi:polar amino acid transport system substrate-binding protein
MSTWLKTVCAVALSASAVTIAGCGSGVDTAQHRALAAINTPPPHVTSTTSPTTPAPLCDVTASLRPPAVMPQPAAMPAGSWMARIKKRGYLLAGVDQNTLLLAYFNPVDRRIEGFEIDLLDELARAIFGDPNAIKFVAVTTAERIPYVQNGTVDVVADATTITCARKQEVDFSTVYLDAAQRLLVPSNSLIGGVQDLAGKRVCATTGSTSIDNIKLLAPKAVIYRVPERTDCLVALQEGRVDAVTSDDSILLGFRAQDPYTKIVGGRLEDEPYGLVISKTHPDLVAFVNGVLERMRKDGVWRAIYSRSLGRSHIGPIPSPPPPNYGG